MSECPGADAGSGTRGGRHAERTGHARHSVAPAAAGRGEETSLRSSSDEIATTASRRLFKSRSDVDLGIQVPDALFLAAKTSDLPAAVSIEPAVNNHGQVPALLAPGRSEPGPA